MGRSEVDDIAILQYLANGYGYTKIAVFMNLSTQQINTRLAKLRKKYHAETTIQLVAHAMRERMIK